MQGRIMSFTLSLSIAELMQPDFTGSDRAAGDPHSDADISPDLRARNETANTALKILR